MIACVPALVWVTQHGRCSGCIAREPRNEKTGAGSSPGCCGEHREVDGPTVQARWRACLEPAHGQIQLAQPCTQSFGRRVAGAAGFIVLQAHMDEPGQEGPCGQDDSVGVEHQPDFGHDAGHAVPLDQEIVDRLLKQRQVRLRLEPMPDRPLVQNAVGLRTRRAHRRPLAGVQDPELDARFVRGERHRPAQRIHLLDQVTLANPADRRVAGHLAERLDVVREQQRGAPHPRRRQGGLGAGVAAAHDNDVETFIELHDFQRLFTER